MEMLRIQCPHTPLLTCTEKTGKHAPPPPQPFSDGRLQGTETKAGQCQDSQEKKLSRLSVKESSRTTSCQAHGMPGSSDFTGHKQAEDPITKPPTFLPALTNLEESPQ